MLEELLYEPVDYFWYYIDFIVGLGFAWLLCFAVTTPLLIVYALYNFVMVCCGRKIFVAY